MRRAKAPPSLAGRKLVSLWMSLRPDETAGSHRPLGPSHRLIIENEFKRLAEISGRGKTGLFLDKRAFSCYLKLALSDQEC
jgi:hypothetical protein